MFRPSIRRSLALFILAAGLCVPQVLSARTPRVDTTPPGARSARSSAGLLASVWGNLSHLWAAEGCMGDPDGLHCAAPSASAAAPSAAFARFWGHLIASWGAAGCIGNPNGLHCAASSATAAHGATRPLPRAPLRP
jgi:hypothetical protein